MSADLSFIPEARCTAPGFLALLSGPDILQKAHLAALPVWPDLFSSPQSRLITVAAVLAVLLVLCTVFLSVYLRRFLIFSKKCGELESDLAKNSRELSGTKNLLAEKSRSHRQMLDDAGTAMFELSELGDCIYANAAMCALLDAPEGRLLGDGLVEFVHPDDRKRVRQEWVGFVAREAPFESSFRFQRADGEVVYATERGGLLLSAREMISGYFGQVMDITQIKQSEQQLRGECEHLEKQLRDCEQKLSAASMACIDAGRQKDTIAAELKQIEATMVSRETQFEQTLAERDKREEGLNGIIQNLEAQKAEAEEARDIRRKELEESAEQCQALSSKLVAIEEEFVARKQQFEETRVEHEKRDEELNQIVQELEAQKAKAEDILDIHRKKLKGSEQKLGELAFRLKEVEKELAARDDREEELGGVIQELDAQKTEAEKALDIRRRQFEEEAEKRKKLDAELQKTRKEFRSEKESLESNSAEQEKQLIQLRRERTSLQRELREARKEVEAARKHVEQNPAEENEIPDKPAAFQRQAV